MPDETLENAGADCLLVVDDQEANLSVLGSTLGRLGFEILPAMDGPQALRRLAVRRPDLILLDLLMPGMDGFELCRRIQENPAWADIPIIFLSAADDKGLIVRALESGGVDYITKPFNKLELVSRVRTQLMLKTARDHLKRLAQDKEELLSIISHQLQNHFAAMEMSAQVLLKRAPAGNDANVRLLEEIRSGSSRMRFFVRSFLANSATDHQFSIQLAPVNLADAVLRAVAPHQEAARSKNISVRTVLPDNYVGVLADAQALTQVLDNLLSNAVKFSPLGGEVVVAVNFGAVQNEFRVQDQGAGFTEEDKSAMFGRYARLSARPTGGEPSTGLGLSIVRKLASAMNGQLICESEPGQGATFILRLPASPQPTEKTS